MDKSQSYWEQELQELPDLTEEEIRDLMSSILQGDASSRSTLLNGMQKRLYEAAKSYETPKIPKMDLFQEGNVALLEFTDAYQETPEAFLAAAMEDVRRAMQRFVASEEESFAAGESLKTKLNVIDEISVRIAEKTGREPTAAEIAELMQTDEDEVRYLLRIALNAIKKD